MNFDIGLSHSLTLPTPNETKDIMNLCYTGRNDNDLLCLCLSTYLFPYVYQDLQFFSLQNFASKSLQRCGMRDPKPRKLQFYFNRFEKRIFHFVISFLVLIFASHLYNNTIHCSLAIIFRRLKSCLWL